MFNLHLLQKKLTVAEYKELKGGNLYVVKPFCSKLSEYLVARCPICGTERIEQLNTYSLFGWGRTLGTGGFVYRCDEESCEHFVLVDTFIHFHGIWPEEAKGEFGPERPHVIGHLLENEFCLAMMHALPLCRIENDEFVPRYTLFMITYYSPNAAAVYNAATAYNVKYLPDGECYVPSPLHAPSRNEQHWWNLPQWVSKGLLYWVDGKSPGLEIRTGDIDAFPYGNIQGREFPHTYPKPIRRRMTDEEFERFWENSKKNYIKKGKYIGK